MNDERRETVWLCQSDVHACACACACGVSCMVGSIAVHGIAIGRTQSWHVTHTRSCPCACRVVVCSPLSAPRRIRNDAMSAGATVTPHRNITQQRTDAWIASPWMRMRSLPPLMFLFSVLLLLFVCCVLCAVCCVLCAVCCVLCAVCCVLCAVRCMLCAVCLLVVPYS